jgi:SAM-dependent methyltransferase
MKVQSSNHDGRSALSRKIAGLVDGARSIDLVRSAVNAARTARAGAIDKWLRIDTIQSNTGGNGSGTTFGDEVFYEATDYLLLLRYMKPLRLGPDDVVYELGCGLGRTLCMFARREVRKCVGIEFNPELATKARANAARLRGRRAAVEVRVADAAHSDYSDGTIFWLNNPFGPYTLSAVMQRIAESLQNRPRTIRIAYIYPFHRDVIDALPWLRCVHREHSIFCGTSEAFYWTNAGLPGYTSSWAEPVRFSRARSDRIIESKR